MDQPVITDDESDSAHLSDEGSDLSLPHRTLQILILFPSDRRQKYDLHLLPEPEYRFFQNCHCNKSTLLEGTLRVWKCHQITIICWCKFLSLQNRCSECLRKSLLLLNLPAQVLQNLIFVFPSTSVKNNSFLKYFCRKSLLSLAKSFLTLSMSLSCRKEPISKIRVPGT